jgi:RNA-directed DNA polymerase
MGLSLGSPGGDAMRGNDLPDGLKAHGLEITAQWLPGRYHPQVIQRVESPKPGSQEPGKLGSPWGIDRLIQQATLNGQQWRWAPTFSACRDGVRPGGSAHQAVAHAQTDMEQGARSVVAIDVEKFFDRLCHDRLLSRLAERITAKRVLQLLRASLPTSILEHGLLTSPTAGTPPGSPRSPFLSHVVVDALDKAREAPGLRFWRDADESHISVRSARASARGMTSGSRFMTQRLPRRVHSATRAVEPPWNRSVCGVSLTGGQRPKRRKIAPQALGRCKARVKAIPKRHQGRSLKPLMPSLSRYLRGWIGSFGVCQTPAVRRDLDRWIRHRRRCLQWKHWTTSPRRKAE